MFLNLGASQSQTQSDQRHLIEVGVVMLSPCYPLLVDAGNVSRSDDYHAPCGFLRRIAHSRSRSCLRTSLHWSDRLTPVPDLRSPHSRVLPQRAGKASHRGINMTHSLQIEADAVLNVSRDPALSSKKVIQNTEIAIYLLCRTKAEDVKPMEANAPSIRPRVRCSAAD